MTVIFLAGGEVETLTRALVENGVRHILYSFHYIHQMRKERFIANVISQNPQIQFFLDSGAFTYWTMGQTQPERLIPFREYIRRYFQYIEEYGELFCRVTEPDFDGTFEEITLSMVYDWREEMLTRWPHLNVIPVWHLWRGTAEWTMYCEDPRIKALALGRCIGPPGLHRRLVMEAHRHGKPVHGFAMTKMQTELKWVPFDSVDSTSWVMGQKYGTTYIFKANKFVVMAKDAGGKDKRRLYRDYYRGIGCDPDLVIADNVAEVRKSNIIAWRNLSARFAEMRKQQNLTYHDFPDLLGKDPAEPVPVPKEREEGIVSKLFKNEKDHHATSVNAWRTHDNDPPPVPRPRDPSHPAQGPKPRPLPGSPEGREPGEGVVERPRQRE